MQADKQFDAGWLCPVCEAPLHPETRDCTSCGQPQAARFARLLTELDHATHAAFRAQAEINDYLAELRAHRRQAVTPAQQTPAQHRIPASEPQPMSPPRPTRSYQPKPAPHPLPPAQPIHAGQTRPQPSPTQSHGQSAPARPMHGQPVPAQPVSGQPVSGQPVLGRLAPGQSAPAQPAPGQPAGQTAPAQSPGQPASAQPASDQPVAGQAFAQPVSGQPVGQLVGQPVGQAFGPGGAARRGGAGYDGALRSAGSLGALGGAGLPPGGRGDGAGDGRRAGGGAGVPRRLSPQALLLGLGVLLVLGAAVTFLAVVWNSLSLSAQMSIITALGLGFLAVAVPASRRRLNGTAEAFAVLGFAVLVAVCIAARVRVLIPAGDTHTYAGLSCAVLALLCWGMHRVVPNVQTFGVATVLVAQAPVPALLIGVADPAVLLLAVGAQALVTARLTAGTPMPVRVTGASCALTGFGLALMIAVARALQGLADGIGQGTATASAAAAVILAATGVLALKRRWFGVEMPRPGFEGLCSASAALAAGVTLAEVPGIGAWAVTVPATALAVADLLRPRLKVDWVLRPMLVTAVAVLATVAVLVSLGRDDLRQVAVIALLIGAVALLARYRDRVEPAIATAIACMAPVAATALLTADELLTPWTGGLICAVLAAGTVSIASFRLGHPDEPAALASGAGALLVGICMMVADSNQTGAGLTLVIAGAPLMAYGRLPRRRAALLVAVVLLTTANTLLVLASDVRLLEAYTLPPALLMLAAGQLGKKAPGRSNESSWVTYGPGLLTGLLPSSVLVVASGNSVRLMCVIAVALVLVVAGTQFTLQAPFVIGTGVLAKLGIWQLILVTPQIPRWVSLGIAGAVLLALGATYERRIADARRTARWVAQLR